MDNFISGLELNELYYNEVVEPILKQHFQEMPYSAALIGWGSEVLGYDDVQSTDHNWGLRFQLFLSSGDREKYKESIDHTLNQHLPAHFRGHPTAFELHVNEDQRDPTTVTQHNIDMETVEGFFDRYLGCDPYTELTAADWLTFSEHKLLAVTSGKVFHDGLGELETIRQKFSYYPRDIWLYILATQWIKIFEEQSFVGRCGSVGDELGSMVIAARQVKNLMHLCFMMERKFAPYGKWFGTAFSRLDCAPQLEPLFKEVLQAGDWNERQTLLAKAYEVVAKMHNALNITMPMKEEATPYFTRPYLVIGDDRFPGALIKEVTSEEVKGIKHGLGSVNQFIDSNDQLNSQFLLEQLKGLFT